MPEPHYECRDDGARQLADALLFLTQTWAVSVEVFLHRRFGERYLGNQGAAVFALVPIYCLLWEQGYDREFVLLFLPFYLLMCVSARVETAALERRGEREHSYYSGWPRLMRALPNWDEEKVKATVEPLLVIVLGGVCCAVHPPFGVYLLIAGFCLAVKTHAEITHEHHLDLDLNDLVIEQERRARRFRGSRHPRS